MSIDTSKPAFTPAICAEAADKAIGQYIQDVGAYGDPEKVRKALEMLTSKCALGYGFVTDQKRVIDMLLRTSIHAATAMEGGKAYQQGTVQ